MRAHDNEQEQRAQRLVAIDIGLINMGVAAVTVYCNAATVTVADRVDITHYNDCPPGCDLHHSRNHCDWVHHFVRRYAALLDEADTILIERQPPGGFKSVEQFLFDRFRSKAELVHPGTLMKFCGTRTMEYDDRKVATVLRAQQRWTDSPIAVRALSLRRAHDVADALMMAAWWVEKLQTIDAGAAVSLQAATAMDAFRCPVDIQRRWKSSK